MLCIIRGEKRWTHQGRTREKTTATKSWKPAVSLISGWQMQETQLRAGSGQSGEPPWFRPRNPSVAQATWPLWKKGWDLLQGVGQSSLTGAAPYTHIAPPSHCQVPATSAEMWRFSGKRKPGGRGALDDLSRWEERPKDTIARVCNWQPAQRPRDQMSTNKPLIPAQSSRSAL